MLYDDFKPVVDLVLNNWTALQLAVEHGMGAPGGQKTAQLMSVYVARYCVENTVCVDDLTETLEDLMDEEFDTVCHDNSPKEIAICLTNFLAMLKEGRQDEVRAQIEAMPPSQRWLSQPLFGGGPPQYRGNPDDDTTSSSDENDAPHDNMQVLANSQLLQGQDHNRFLNNGQSDTNAQGGTNGQGGTNDHAQASSSHDEPMDQDEEPVDPGWTVVKTRRKKN